MQTYSGERDAIFQGTYSSGSAYDYYIKMNKYEYKPKFNEIFDSERTWGFACDIITHERFVSVKRNE